MAARRDSVVAPIGDVAYQSKEVMYDILFKATAETLITIATGTWALVSAFRRPSRRNTISTSFRSHIFRSFECKPLT